MSAYLKFFELERSPFEGSAQAKVVLGTKALREAFGTIGTGLDEGVARICVNGGRGLGKTSLAKALPKLLGETARVAIVLDPAISWDVLRGSIAKQWGLTEGRLSRASLLEAASDRRLVLVVDQAESAPEDFLDHLDILLSYRSEEDQPVVQSVLLARLGREDQRDPAPLVWWLDRIQTLQLEFAPLPREGIDSYIQKHLKRAGWKGERLFSSEAALAIHGYTGGIPGEVSRVCERLLALAAEENLREIEEEFVHASCEDEDGPTDEDGDERVEDEFEELALEDQFQDGSGEPDPSLEETLTHFEQAEKHAPATADEPAEPGLDETEAFAAPDETSLHVVGEVEADGSMPAFDEPFYGPATPEELRAIRGSLFARNARPIAAAAIAALIGGLAVAWLTGDGESTSLDASDSSGRVGIAGEDGPPKVLGRLRGPVPSAEHAASPIAVAQPSVPNRVERPTAKAPPPAEDWAGEGPDEDAEFEELVREDDLVDMRPASMRPSAQ